jgi:hypothetical protein
MGVITYETNLFIAIIPCYIDRKLCNETLVKKTENKAIPITGRGGL